MLKKYTKGLELSRSPVQLPWIQFVKRCNLHLHPEYLMHAYLESIMFLPKIPTYSNLAYKRISAPGNEQVWTNWMPVKRCKPVCKKECKPCYLNEEIFQPGSLCLQFQHRYSSKAIVELLFSIRTEFLVHLFLYVPRNAPPEASVLSYLLCTQGWLCIPANCSPWASLVSLPVALHVAQVSAVPHTPPWQPWVCLGEQNVLPKELWDQRYLLQLK